VQVFNSTVSTNKIAIRTTKEKNRPSSIMTSQNKKSRRSLFDLRKSLVAKLEVFGSKLLKCSEIL
jgi:hypothetical protein